MPPRVGSLVKRGVLPPPNEALSSHLSPAQTASAVHAGLIGAASASGSRLAATDFKMLRALEAKSKRAYAVISTLWRSVAWTSGFLEVLPKISADMTMRKRGIKPTEAAAMARLSGIPNPGVAAKMTSMADLVFLFARVQIQGLRAMRTKALNPTTRAGYLTRTLLYMGLPTLAAQLGGLGALDAVAHAIFGGEDDKDKQVDFEEMWKRANPYKLESYVMVPVGWNDEHGRFHLPFGHDRIPASWTPIFANLGSTEDTKFVQPIVFNSWHSAMDNFTPIGAGLSPVRPFKRIAENVGGLLMPGLNPSVNIVTDVASLTNDKPPVNTFTGRPATSEDVWDAGGFTRTWGLMQYEIGRIGQAIPFVGSAFRPTQPNVSLAPWASVLKRIPGANTLLAMDNYAGIREEQRARVLDDKRRATARLQRGPNTEAMAKRYGVLSTKPKERRTEAESEEYAILSKWYSKYYTGTEKHPGLFKVIHRAQTDPTVDGQGAVEALEDSATRIKEQLRDLRMQAR